MKKFLDKIREFFFGKQRQNISKPVLINRKSEFKTFRQTAHSKQTFDEKFFLEDLKKQGLSLKKIDESQKRIVEKNQMGKVVYASQFAGVLPLIPLLKKGIYQITFSPQIQAQIQSGAVHVTGGVARNASGEIMSHGILARGSAILFAPLIIYQIGNIAFGTFHLQKIGKSLKKINEKLKDISNFQQDKRSFQIRGGFQEFFHLCEGIIEFNKRGNINEVLNRLAMIKQLRFMNLPNLLHLGKNLKDLEEKLKFLKEESFNIGSEKDRDNLEGMIHRYQNNQADFGASLLLDIILTKTEHYFSQGKSLKELESRISFQEEQIEFLKRQTEKFSRLLKKKIPEIINNKFWAKEKQKKNRRYLRDKWKKMKKSVLDYADMCSQHIQSMKEINTKDNIFYLKVDSDSDSKVA